MTPTPSPDPGRCPECGCGWWEPHRTGCSEPRFLTPDPAAAGEGGGTVHAVPPHGSANTPCCDRSPFDLPAADRITVNAAEVTCASADEGARQRPDTAALRSLADRIIDSTGLPYGAAGDLLAAADWIDATPGPSDAAPDAATADRLVTQFVRLLADWDAPAELLNAAAALAAPVPERPQPDGDLVDRLYDANGFDDIKHHEREVRMLLAEAADALAAAADPEAPTGPTEPDAVTVSGRVCGADSLPIAVHSVDWLNGFVTVVVAFPAPWPDGVRIGCEATVILARPAAPTPADRVTDQDGAE